MAKFSRQKTAEFDWKYREFMTVTFHPRPSFLRKFLKQSITMTKSSPPPRSNKHSIKYRCSPLEGASFEIAADDDKDFIFTSSGNGRKSEPKSPDVLSTAELVSAVGQIWDCASRPLTFLKPKTNLRHIDGEFSEGRPFCYSSGIGNEKLSAAAENQYVPVDFMNSGHSSPIARVDLEFLRVCNKISFFEPYNENSTQSLLQRSMKGSKIPKGESWEDKNLSAIGISYDLRNIYRWMSEISLPGLKQKISSTVAENKNIGECRSCCDMGDAANTNDYTNGNVDAQAEKTNLIHFSSVETYQSMTAVPKASSTSLCSDYFLQNLQRTEANSRILTLFSGLRADYYIKYLASDSHAYEAYPQRDEDDHMHVDKKNQPSEFVLADKSKVEGSLLAKHKTHYGLAKQEHAFAGALAGIFVSLCLHPVDTIKTVIQSCHVDQRSINFIGRSIISERGVTGLYRGISSNIASSAPISAVYTFTYESVKGALLPFLPTGYQSLAHCVGGGCASIATSFIFTPSERIKQQMQVGLHYQNCWNAVVGIIKKGGLPSLYAGWGAVLCRNVPHSIIKFYTYESLKHLMLSSLGPNAQPNTFQTLICGGIAGSTAALFTTPFDVVKTRLQTQIPGSIHQYNGVFNTLIEIGKHEGLKGLYRGLIPRLVMYISQGAIFFASYESFKRLFSMDLPHLYAPTVDHMDNIEDEAPCRYP